MHVVKNHLLRTRVLELSLEKKMIIIRKRKQPEKENDFFPYNINQPL